MWRFQLLEASKGARRGILLAVSCEVQNLRILHAHIVSGGPRVTGGLVDTTARANKKHMLAYGGGVGGGGGGVRGR